jgi:hypothetical protein
MFSALLVFAETLRPELLAFSLQLLEHCAAWLKDLSEL